MHMDLTDTAFPARSIADALRVYVRPEPFPERLARSSTVKLAGPFGVMTISPGLTGSLLVPITVKDPGATPERASPAVTVATLTIVPLGGHRLHPAPGIPEIAGAVLSMLVLIDWSGSTFPALSV